MRRFHPTLTVPLMTAPDLKTAEPRQIEGGAIIALAVIVTGGTVIGIMLASILVVHGLTPAHAAIEALLIEAGAFGLWMTWKPFLLACGRIWRGCRKSYGKAWITRKGRPAMSIELKPCPFCGDEPEWVELVPDLTKISCKNSDCKMMPEDFYYPSPQETAASWNKRADSA